MYAGIWFTTHAVLALGMYLLVAEEWRLLVIYGICLIMANGIRYPKDQDVIDFFVPAFEQGFGGVQLVRNDVGRRTHETPTMYCIHPHAIVANGLGLAMHDCVMRGEKVTLATASILCWFNPLFRWFVNSMGCDLASVSRDSLARLMRNGANIAIIPGGFEEVMFMQPGADVVYLRNRMGFMRLAIQYGYSLVPVYTFGESELYHNGLSLPHWLKTVSAKTRLPLVIPRGCSWWNMMPCVPRMGLRIVFGEPLTTVPECNPTRATVHKVHQQYIEALTVLYRKYNPYPESGLRIR